tara:strand:- start:802 stop:1275 length:474 start_codon:yes stop_codon:yes gene_type:complete
MSWQNWESIVQNSVINYYHSEYHKKYMKKLKEQIKYLLLQEANNELFEYIKNKNNINFVYNNRNKSCKTVLFEYKMYKIFKNYRIYWLINEQKKLNNRIETISELLNKYFKSLISKKFKIYHTIDYLDNYKCRLILKIYDIDNFELMQNDQTKIKHI